MELSEIIHNLKTALADINDVTPNIDISLLNLAHAEQHVSEAIKLLSSTDDGN